MSNNEKNKFDEEIEKSNEKIAHMVWTIFLSMITAIIVVLAATG